GPVSGESDAEDSDHLAASVLIMKIWTRSVLRQLFRLHCVMLGVFITLTAHAQQPQLQPPQQNQQPYTLKVSTQLVIETVVVKDKDGKPLEDLTAKDFSVTEDGVPQAISIFEFQRLDDSIAPPPILPPASSITGTAPSAASNQISRERPGDIRYRNRRLIAL